MNPAILFGSTYGDTADAAERIAAAFEKLTGCRVPLFEVAYTDLRALEAYDPWLLGCSTWHVGELQADWQMKVEELARLDLRGKQVALFGAGDQRGYPDSFQDALGILAERLETRGAEIRGLWPVAGYEHTSSLAQRGEYFVGLALDYTSQEASTQRRIEAWVEQLVREFAAGPRATDPQELAGA